ncbi:putative lipoprotein with Yx(FWY)xxD motif [Krasilnikovia cinnamomea]|uniref:Putative lipoprotein with Yx(FWY)xxD motif n=1 Tax=Krasilnikovia cinnamomea TaxID=349313 RepID=A0A4Q7ZIJ4_9ACTN|nr:hypothetical protein [Krasilnikovia cinnamomea]RZU50035.1 putative lipoprotein with Yx(FWY)xxD motif [Krasilnikovia cinnamomea]
MRQSVGRPVSSVLCGALLAAGAVGCSGPSERTAPKPSAPAASANAAAAPTGVQLADSAIGSILVDQSGRSLYAFTADKGGASSCTGACIATWPALTSEKAVTLGSGLQASLLTTVSRGEGASQAVYGGWPLYYYAGDLGPGDLDGQGVDGTWFAIGRDGKLIKDDPAG